MEGDVRRTRGKQRGPRSEEVVSAVSQATLREIARGGVEALTIDAVARNADVHRTTVYRRWPTRSALLQAVIEPLLHRYDTAPDTGSLRGDLEALMREVSAAAGSAEGRALTAAIQASSEELHDLAHEVQRRALSPFRIVVERGVARGEVEDADADALCMAAFFGIVMWDQAHERPASPEDCERLARLLTALRP